MPLYSIHPGLGSSRAAHKGARALAAADTGARAMDRGERTRSNNALVGGQHAVDALHLGVRLVEVEGKGVLDTATHPGTEPVHGHVLVVVVLLHVGDNSGQDKIGCVSFVAETHLSHTQGD